MYKKYEYVRNSERLRDIRSTNQLSGNAHSQVKRNKYPICFKFVQSCVKTIKHDGHTGFKDKIPNKQLIIFSYLEKKHSGGKNTKMTVKADRKKPF